MGDRDGRVRELGRDVQQLHNASGRGQDRRGGCPRAGLSSSTRGIDGGDRAPARESHGRRPARVRAPRSRVLSYRAVPGLVEQRDAFGEITLVVDTPRLVEAARHLRDELGFNFLSDISAADYLGWGGKGVSGYITTPSGRDLSRPSTQGLQRLPRPK